METLRYGHDQKDGENSKIDQLCDDTLGPYESDVLEHAESDCLDQSMTNDFSVRESMTPQSLMSRKEIEEALHQIVADIKNKRENDLHILSDVKKEIMAQAEHSCNMLEQYMDYMHVVRSKDLDKQITVLMSILNKTEKLEAELDHSKTSLSLLCKDFSTDPQYL